MQIQEQIESGRLRCVHTHQALRLVNGELRSEDGAHRYPLHGGVPIVLKDAAGIKALADANPAMEREYYHPGLYQKLREFLYKDSCSRHYRGTFDEYIRRRGAGDLVLQVGGGPLRNADHITNLNIGPYPNVDIVGDAHDLPYHDACVDAIVHEAVLEHLRDPIGAVREMRRVLKPGAPVLSAIPFMQAYHGYPDHYQNYTISGHRHLYESNGFKVLRAGVPNGPITALTALNARFAREYFPPVLNILCCRLIQAAGFCLLPLDRLLERRDNAHILASTTFVLAVRE